VSKLSTSHRSTFYLCCGQALEGLKGAGRIGLTRVLHIRDYFSFAVAKVDTIFDSANVLENYFQRIL